MQKLTADLTIVVPGDVYPTNLEAGTEVSGRVAEVAARLGLLEGVEPVRLTKPDPTPHGRETAAMVAAPEAKRGRGRPKLSKT